MPSWNELVSCSRWFFWMQAVNLLVDIFQTLHFCFWGNILQHHPKISRNKQPLTNTHTHTHTQAHARKAITYRMTDNLSKLAYVSFVWELKQEDSWGISDSNLFLRQYASTTCMSQMIIYSLLSAQNVWINSCECFGLHEAQESTSMSSMHEFELLIHRWESCSVFASASDPITSANTTCII